MTISNGEETPGPRVHTLGYGKAALRAGGEATKG
jgi:hypothetical protein